ncbi:hypothetical protein GGI23_001016 [Coemansia sp. RSA 2559]|nr:hypothetical protein GGI23_001016 [Coemansia sp. RSA 2559]
MRHPEADMLYVLSVDLGESDSVDRSTGRADRTIVSGLVKYYSSEELLGKRVVVFANIKPRKLRGVASQGMLLAASSMENAMPKVEVLEAPEGSCPGDRVTARLGSQDGKDTPNRGGLETNSSPKPLIKRQKIINAFIQDLRLDKRTAMYQGRSLVSENGGYIATKSMVSGTIG